MNSVDRKITKRVLSIDSLFRNNYYTTKSTDFIYTLPDPINKVTSMKVASIECPNAWYTISSENNSNVFTITIYNCPTPIDKTVQYGPILINKIEIPAGNYRSDFLSIAVNNIFSNVRNGLEFLYFDLSEIIIKRRWPF
jgi:hypothetical protein